MKHYSSLSYRFESADVLCVFHLPLTSFILHFLLNCYLCVGALSSSAVFVLGTVVFVMACYPTGKVSEYVWYLLV